MNAKKTTNKKIIKDVGSNSASMKGPEVPNEQYNQIGSFNAVVAPDQLVGKYSNVALFRHSKREFIIDFLNRIDNSNFLVSRIITNPQHVKEIYKALGQNIEIYEKNHGKIKKD